MTSETVSSSTIGSAPNSNKGLVSFAFSGSPSITSEKLNGKNYMDWHAAVDIWFLGQGLSDHLTTKSEAINAVERDQWKRADYQLVSLLWQSIDSKLMVHFRTYKTCYDIWKKAQTIYSNDVQRLYDVVHKLTTLQMTDHDLPAYLNKAQSTIEEVKMILTSDDLQNTQSKVDNMCMVFVLHGLHKDMESVRNQILTNPSVPTTVDLIDRLLRVPSPETTLGVGLQSGSESSALFSRVGSQSSSDSPASLSNFASRGGRGRGRGRGGGRGNIGRPQCTYCKRMGHTQDKCYSLVGYPERSANVTHYQPLDLEKQDEGWSTRQNALSDTEYKEYLQFKATQQASSSADSVTHTGNSTVCLSQASPAGSWILDSGASDHIAGNPSLFLKLSQPKIPHCVTLANGSKVKATGIGQTTPFPSLNLNSVLLIPGCPFNLVSVSQLTRTFNCSITFTNNSFTIQDRSTGQTLGTGIESHGLYYFQHPSPVACVSSDSPNLIHCRLGHPSLNKLKEMVPQLSKIKSLECESCQLGKHVRASFPQVAHCQSTLPFDLVHSDVWGPSRVSSILGFRYFVIFIDDFSRCTWIYLMKERSELFTIFEKFCTEIRNQFNQSIRMLRSDNAKEYFSGQFNNFMTSHGIIHQSTCPHTPQQNGIAERKHRHIIETARTLLLSANAPIKFWGDAVLTAVFLINRMPSSVLNNKVPYSLLFPRDNPSKISPRVFGSTCFVHDLSPGRDKLSASAIKCIFLGYSTIQKGYRCYNPSTHRFYISASVTFFEDTPYFSTPVTSEIISQVLPLPLIHQPLVLEDSPVSTVQPVPPVPPTPNPLIVYQRRPRPTQVEEVIENNTESSDPTPVQSSAPASDPSSELPIALRKGIRSSRNSHPIYNCLSYHRLSSSHNAFVSALSSISIPKTVQEALSHPGWQQAMIDEMTALDSNHTWTLVPLPPQKSTVGCRWVFNIKVGPDGRVDRLKARLVAKGYTQQFGLDYSETFSPVAKMPSVRLFLSMAAMRAWPLHQLDIKNAFLHGDLIEEVYMEQPPGFVAQGESRGFVCKLHKSLYGLKQSPRAWFSRFSHVIQQFGMIRSDKDHSVFYKHSSSGQCIYLLVYVDDIIITGNDHDGIKRLKYHLFQHFQTKDLGPLRYFLGIEVARSRAGIAISQRKYALDILKETGMLDCKPVDTPMDPNVKLVTDQGEPYSDPGRYRRLVGKLNYLTMTRPDISFAVSVLSQFLNSPLNSHWDAIVRILRYIKGSPGKGLVYENRGHTEILAYSDADWAGCPNDRKSTTGYCILIGGNLISWKSKKQTVVARSSAEAEYRAMALTAGELAWLKHLLSELKFCKVESMKLICDNQAALHIASNPVFHERTKHIEVDCHHVRQKVIAGEISTSFVNSKDQLADIFTKSLRGPRISYICDKLDAFDIYAPA